MANTLMRSARWWAALACVCLLQACATVPGGPRRPAVDRRPFPPVRFATISDPHYFDPALGTTGIYFQRAVRSELKLFADADEVIRSALADLPTNNVSFLIIAGDLTKDGERSSHERMAEMLAAVEDRGVSVYVMPGNHDLENRMATRYLTNGVESVASIDRRQFAALYGRFGFQEALARDRHSLSYVAEPAPGLWLIVLDSVKPTLLPGKRPPPGTGEVKRETMDWLERVLRQARKRDKAVLVALHHGLLDHFPREHVYFHHFFVSNRQPLMELLVREGVPVVFTGHFHAHAITAGLVEWKEREAVPGSAKTLGEETRSVDYALPLLEIQSGSLTAPPCPYRVITIDSNQVMTVESRFVTATASHPDDFPAYAASFYDEQTRGVFSRMIKKARAGKAAQDNLAPLMGGAFRTKAYGSASVRPGRPERRELSWWGRFMYAGMKIFLRDAYRDNPPDNLEVQYDLQRGAVCGPAP